jgi:hypothetical protein
MARANEVWVDTKRLELYVISLFRRAGFDIDDLGKSAGYSGFNFVAWRVDLGKKFSYAVTLYHGLFRREDVLLLGERYRLTPKRNDLMEHPTVEHWVVAEHIEESAYDAVAHKDPRRRIFTLEALENVLKPWRPPGARSAKARTQIGKAVVANASQLRIMIAALRSLIDEKIETLRAQRPNSDESVGERDASIDEYMRLGQQVDALGASIDAFKKKALQEKEVVKAVKTFADGIQAWWEKHHERICDSAFGAGLFTTAISVCSLAGSQGKTVAIIVGAIAGGKPLVDALRGLGKKWW